MTNSPSNAIPAIEIPGDGRLLGFPELDPPASNDSAAASLQTQVAPLLAMLSCQVKVMRLLQPLITVITQLPTPTAQALEEFKEAAEALAPCFAALTPLGILPFLRGLLCLEIRSLNCFLQNLQNAAASAGSDQSPFSTAQVQGILDSYVPIAGTLPLAGELFAIAGMMPPQAPALGAGTDAASLKADQDAVGAFVAELQLVADALGGCA